MTTFMVITQGLRDSHEDIEAQRGIFFALVPSSLLTKIAALETIQGDSMSPENMMAYINILRSYGALRK
jgi:hypothetical protein